MSIKILLGCMYSGKTSELIAEYNRWVSISKNVTCINFEGDDRYGTDDKLYSHNLYNIQCEKVTLLEQLSEEIIKKSDVILINEGQFFGDLVEYCVKWCDEYGKNIIVSGLDGDFQRQPFGKILDLIPKADEVVKLNAFCAICKDGTHAMFTKRLTNEQEQVVIGSTNYIAVCRKHYNES